MVRISASVDCGPVFSTLVCILVQKNVARNAFRDAPTIPQYVTIIEPNWFWNSALVSKAWILKKTAALIAPEHNISWVRIPSQPSVHQSKSMLAKETVAKLRPTV